jgi:SAM-dependent methyltransferase
MLRDGFFEWFFPGAAKGDTGLFRILETILPEKGVVLDLGCGDNSLLAPFRTQERRLWGTDLQAHPNLQNPGWFRLMDSDGRIPFVDETFDVVASCWVLEHVEDPVPFLQEVARVLRPGGAFVSLSVSSSHYVTWITRLVGWLPHRFTQGIVHRLYGREHHDTFPTHFRLNSTRRLRNASFAAGLELGAMHRAANPGYFSFFRPLECLAIVTDWAVSRMLPACGKIFFVATMRKPERTSGSQSDQVRAA